MDNALMNKIYKLSLGKTDVTAFSVNEATMAELGREGVATGKSRSRIAREAFILYFAVKAFADMKVDGVELSEVIKLLDEVTE